MSDYLTMPEYITFARKLITQRASVFRNKFLRDDDAISYVAERMMWSDAKYNPDKGMKRSSNRYRYGRYAVKTLISKFKKRRQEIMEFSKFKSSLSLSNCCQIEQNKLDSEYCEDKQQVNFLLNNSGLTPTEKKYVEEHYLNNTSVKKIAENNDISRQAVEQGISLGLQKMRRVTQNVV